MNQAETITEPSVPGRRVKGRQHRSRLFPGLAKDPLWYKDAIIYEVHVRAFFDSNADGIGDFRGLTQKLDYLQDLGITTIWLLPFYPSPLKDDGYDIADYNAINPMYGTLRDFKEFLGEAHRRRLRVITELVVNHTSDQHPWFQKSRRAAPGSSWRNFYVWSETAEKYKGTRIIFRDFEPSNWTWDPLARAWYWHRFYSHQPDLNYDNPQVHKEIRRVLDFWLDMGVDGLRLDAVPYLYEREGTSCENLPETHAYLKSLRQHVDEKYGDRMLLAEANQWPEEAVTYFGTGKGDECHMAFHFPLMPRIFMAVRMEDSVPIVDILEQTPAIPETSQWALFLRNHDELTLEMVTDEERDYMYRVYADDAKARINLGIRRRLAPLLGNDRKRIELLHLLLFSFPGTPVLYYGDEIGMGDNIFLGDRNGVRTPMQWSQDKNAGFSRASPQALYFPIILDPEYHYEAVNVEVQQRNPHSLFWWTKRVLTLRKRYPAFGRGSLRFLRPENRKILAFLRQWQDQTLLVVANLSRWTQPVHLNLGEFRNHVPVEVFGRSDFPPITDEPYFMTLSPHAAFWFSLEPVARTSRGMPDEGKEVLTLYRSWQEFVQGQDRHALEACLARYLEERGWFKEGHQFLTATEGEFDASRLRRRRRRIKNVQVEDAVEIPGDGEAGFLLVATAELFEGEPEDYLLPIAYATGEAARRVVSQTPQLVIRRVRLAATGEEGVLYDGIASPELAGALLEAMSRRKTFSAVHGDVRASGSATFRNETADGEPLPSPVLLRSESIDSAIAFGDTYFLKLFRQLHTGVNPELEAGRFLTEREFANVPHVAGALEYSREGGDIFTLGILTRFQRNAKDAWEYSLDMMSRYFERVRSASGETRQLLKPGLSLMQAAQNPVPEAVVALIGTYLEMARLLGRRVGEMHQTLASDPENRDFAPEPFTRFYQRSLYQSMRNLAVTTLQAVRNALNFLPEGVRAQAEKVTVLEPQILHCLRAVHEFPLHAQRIRCHGDLHLGQILFTGKDFVILDFEGESSRPQGERRIKRSPLRDVAGMIRSFDYITYAALFRQLELGNIQEQDLTVLEPWTGFWFHWVSAEFLKSYLQVVHPTDLLPRNHEELAVLLTAHLAEKALYEVGHELNYRPNWLKIPLNGIMGLLASGHTS